MKNISYSNLSEKEFYYGVNLRSNCRYKYDEDFKIIVVNSKKVSLQAYGVDISVSGMGFKSEAELKENDMVEIIFKFAGISILTIARIAHSSLFDKGFFYGCQFIAIQNLYRDILKGNLKQQIENN